jgi:hypothetical protein
MMQQQIPPPNMQTAAQAVAVMNNHHGVGHGGHDNSNNSAGAFRGPNLQQPPPNHHMKNHPPPPPRVSNRGGHGGPQTNGTSGGIKEKNTSSNRGGEQGGGNLPGTVNSINNVQSVGSHPVLETLRSANEYNPKSFDMNPKYTRYFVIKSFSEDDIHRSIKYEIWCSTDHGNKRLDAAYKAQKSATNGQGTIYLFFSVNGSGHFCGMAEMLSAVDYSNTGSCVWVQDKFKGQFKVKWIYVKDVPNTQLRHIRLENNENKPVTNSRDTQEVPPDKGKMVLKILHSFKHTTSLFDDFVHYEKKQEEEDIKKKHEVVQDNRGERGGNGGGGDRPERGAGGHHEGRHEREQRSQPREHQGHQRGEHGGERHEQQQRPRREHQEGGEQRGGHRGGRGGSKAPRH